MQAGYRAQKIVKIWGVVAVPTALDQHTLLCAICEIDQLWTATALCRTVEPLDDGAYPSCGVATSRVRRLKC
jgi:hypothetical protein